MDGNLAGHSAATLALHWVELKAATRAGKWVAWSDDPWAAQTVDQKGHRSVVHLADSRVEHSVVLRAEPWVVSRVLQLVASTAAWSVFQRAGPTVVTRAARWVASKAGPSARK